MPGPYTHPNASKQYDTPASVLARKSAEQKSAIAATAPARKADRVNTAQRGHNLAQSISDDISQQAGPIGQMRVEHARQRLETDRYNALTPDQRSAEYAQKQKVLEDASVDPLSHGAMTPSQIQDVQEHKQHIDALKKGLQNEPAAAGAFGTSPMAPDKDVH